MVKCLSCRYKGLSLVPTVTVKRAGVVANANLSTGEAETGGALRPAGQAA